MTIKIDQRKLKVAKWPLAVAVAATISAPAQAFQFMLGEIEGSLDTTLTAGASWRMEGRDTDQIGKMNLTPAARSDWAVGGVSVNSDDGNLNFEKGETYSKIFKGTSDMMLQYEDFGMFTRARYFYDVELMNEEVAADENGVSRPLIPETLDAAGAGAEILDAFVWMDSEIGEMPVNFRLGKQVLGWGESTFLFGGASVINPIDAAAARAPGAEVKDVLLPVNMFYTSIGLTDAVTAEAFYQLEWEKTRSDPCGTFFSTNDAAADGCGPIWLSGGEGAELLGTDFASTRLDDVEADDEGQFGVALRWYAAELGDTEFGLYYINYHSRLPYGSFVINDPANGRFFSNYFLEYPEDLQSIALSFNTSTESGWSIGGEVSLRPNFPIARNGFEMTASSNAFLGNQSLSAFNEEARNIGAGGILRGYEEYDVYQAQMTFIKFFDQILGASRMTFVSEVGAVYVDSLPENNRLGRNSAFGIGENPGYPGNSGAGTDPGVPSLECNQISNANPRFCNNDGFVTEVSAGYRMRASLEYSDVFAGVNMTPTLIWSHDVLGYAPEPGGQFTEDARAIGFSLTGVYQSKYSATIGYTNFFGGEPYNVLNDRDNVSASVSVSF
ncbi:MAG: DUF1302 domain-containing protein [Hahellaceae bacterium]|nr:DUF1302 domain-containing protein [Hahellaceae bacterium]